MVLIELIFNSLYIGRGYGGLERTDFVQFLLLEGVVVLKELIFNSYYFGWGCSSFERTDV